jgi:hypothetical protein
VLVYFGQFFIIFINSPHFWLLSLIVKVVHYFDLNVLGDILHKLLWSPWERIAMLEAGFLKE